MSNTKVKKHNGKPMSHWETEARRIVVTTLVDKALKYEHGAHLNPMHARASQSFMDLANGIDRTMVNEYLDWLANAERHLASVFGSIIGSSRQK